jgi:DNA-binding NarL/FixJ family response regulator
MTTTIALDAALQAEARQSAGAISVQGQPIALSDQLATILTTTTMALVGTEAPLPASVSHAFLHLAELLDEFQCDYSRLVYGAAEVVLEAIVAIPVADESQDVVARWRSRCYQLRFIATCLGGSLLTEPGPQQQMVQVTLQVPYRGRQSEGKVSIRCDAALVQVALTCLAYRAGLTVCDAAEPGAILITDSEAVAQGAPQVIWVRTKSSHPTPPQAKAVVDWTVNTVELQQVVQCLSQGKPVEPLVRAEGAPPPSERERAIMALLAQGLRDRDIANRLYISESTVKFHINNSLAKLRAKNRYQAVYQSALQGWI